MKQCPFCGAQIADDSRFCSECGKEITQANVCPHCGASVGEGDAFCQNCGKSIKENAVTDPSKKTCPHCEAVMNDGDVFCQNCGKKPTDTVKVADEAVNEEYEEEQPKSGFKKYLPYILGAFVILCVLGYIGSKSSNGSNDSMASDTLAVDTVAEESVASNEIAPISKEQLESMLSHLTGVLDTAAVVLSFTERYKEDFFAACRNADRNGQERPRVWWSYSDSDPENYGVDKLEMTDADNAKAWVKMSSDLYDGMFELILNNENGEWRIDKINELGVEDVRAFEANKDADYEENLDWLQGHWVYEQGSYKGHFIIQGDKITQYSSMNPERETSTFTVEGDEIVSRIANGVNLTVKIDFANQTIDYGDGNWMHKIE